MFQAQSSNDDNQHKTLFIFKNYWIYVLARDIETDTNKKKYCILCIRWIPLIWKICITFVYQEMRVPLSLFFSSSSNDTNIDRFFIYVESQWIALCAIYNKRHWNDHKINKITRQKKWKKQHHFEFCVFI